ncbi:hypothetical protein PCASD_14724 [Puccinia coronata f. sp. avenae]|uniref:Uncharacterized protein n=1 Tax=Puccinia coronata f. sp. avenae TaxID=200324 RepID=A0A2N5TD22_9BASI|nr:hypothetical protein PCASD_14724 [Puccinia coronata f. sp. avenae]
MSCSSFRNTFIFWGSISKISEGWRESKGSQKGLRVFRSERQALQLSAVAFDKFPYVSIHPQEPDTGIYSQLDSIFSRFAVPRDLALSPGEHLPLASCPDGAIFGWKGIASFENCNGCLELSAIFAGGAA